MKKTILFTFLGAFALLASCSDSSDSRPVNVDFYMTDAPAEPEYKAILIDVQRIEYSTSGGNWVSLPIRPVIVDILKYANGADTLLSNIRLQAGVRVEQIRLVLGPDNTLVLQDGSSHALGTPSGQTSGLKLNVHANAPLPSGYKVVIDFDATRSIVVRGNGSYSLKPVIRAFIEANTAVIYGLLTPSKTPARVFTLTIEGDTIATISDTTRNNYFLLRGLFSGTYDLQVQDLTTQTIYPLKSGVTVTGGTDYDQGTLTLPFPAE